MNKLSGSSLVSRNKAILILMIFLFVALFVSLPAEIVCAQVVTQSGEQSQYYSRKNTFGVYGAYSNTSSHLLMGEVRKRKLLEFGAVYNRRLYQNHIIDWQYSGEVLPIAVESDPMIYFVTYQQTPTVQVFRNGMVNIWPGARCVNEKYSYTGTENGVITSGTASIICGRRWVGGEAVQPIGFQWNFMPQKKLQAFLNGHGGLMVSNTEIPIDQASAFNFTFDFGAGVELYKSHKSSVRTEVRFHHISNHDLANQNPGIDHVLFQLTYAFGK